MGVRTTCCSTIRRQPGAEFQWLEVINRTLTDEQKRDPATQEMYKRFAAALMPGANMSMLNFTEVK